MILKLDKQNNLLMSGIEILNIIKSLYPDSVSYIVGGTVRDLILNKHINDIDISTSVDVNLLESHFKTHDIGKNKDFSIIVVEYNGFNIEIANFRLDGQYLDGRHPDNVKIVSSFEEDVKRRDFTCNALGMDLNGNIIDYVGGVLDITNKVLRTVGKSTERFKEDYIRMLRACRFSAKLGFKIEDETFNAIKENSNNISKIAIERIMQEVNKAADSTGEQFAYFIDLLDKTNLLEYILPEVKNFKNLPQSKLHHPEGETVYKHTIEALKVNKQKNQLINLCILFHDIGKNKVHSVDEEGIHHYYKHELESDELVEYLALRLKIDNETRDTIKFVCKNHMMMHIFLNLKRSTIVKLLYYKDWNILYAVSKADGECRKIGNIDEEWILIDEKIKKIKEEFKNKEFIDNIRKEINGNYIMSLRPDLKPSKELGLVIKNTVDFIIDKQLDVINDKSTIIDFILRV